MAHDPKTQGKKRSSKWRKVRNAYKKKNPKCALCKGKVKVEIHHKKPFHLFPELELVKNNLISLCESGKYGITCHQLVGHLGNYKRYNPNVEIDVIIWNYKLKKN